MKLDRLLWILGLCVVVYVGYKVAVFMLPPPNINISREQYDQALAKSHSQRIQEYEMVVTAWKFPGGPWRLRVHSEGAAERILEYSWAGDKQSSYEMTSEAFQDLTVASLFGLAQGVLSNRSNEISFGCPCYSIVNFDQTLGYPVHLEIHPRSRDVFDADRSITVESLTILKRGTPAAAPTP